MFSLFQVLEAFSRAEKKLKPNPELMFTDVYDEMTPELKKQLSSMKEHVQLYKENYPLGNFESMDK